jgi:hypothetical protein
LKDSKDKNMEEEIMKKDSKIQRLSTAKRQNVSGSDATDIEFDEPFMEADQEDDQFEAIIKKTNCLIETYCSSEKLKMDAGDFEIFIDGRGNTCWFSVKIGNANNAMVLVAYLLKHRYAKCYLKLRDHSREETIFEILLCDDKKWRLGISGYPGEVYEWIERNKDAGFHFEHS